TMPAIRNFGSVVFPGGANVPIVRTGPAGVITPAAIATGQGFPNNPGRGFPNNQGFNNQGSWNNQFGNRNNNFRNSANMRWNNTNTFVSAYPVFVGGGYDSSFVGSDPPEAPAVAPPMVMYPPEPARPAMVQVAPGMSAYQTPPAAAAADDDSTPDSERY